MSETSIFATDMARCNFFFILIWLLCFFGLAANITTIVDFSVDEDDCMVCVPVASSSDTMLDAAGFEPVSCAELGGLLTPHAYSSFLRLHRSHYSETFCTLKIWIQKLSARLLELSNSRIYSCSFSSFFHCQPVCQYYIFTLRRILI